MLKFLRKYQLLVLAFGGSLLMVVFLLQPILQRFGPNPMNKKVAEIGQDAQKVSRGDRERARVEVQLLEDYLPWMPRALGINETHPGDHWLLLKHAAREAGLIGEAGDGRQWMGDLIAQQLSLELQAMRSQGRFPTPEEREQIAEQVRQYLTVGRERVAAGARLPLDEFDRILAEARGVLRMQDLYISAARVSDRRLVSEAAERGASALADALVLTPELVAPSLPDPTEEAMTEHLARYGDIQPGDTDDNRFGVGYLQPPRIHLEYLRLDPATFEAVAEVDRVELRKRWQTQYPDGTDEQFRQQRAALEQQLRAEQADDMMQEADQIVRGELLRLTRPLERDGAYVKVPGDWAAAGPDFERLAQTVVSQIQDRLGVRIPAPEVVRRTDRWLTRNDLAMLPGFGRATYRVGAQQVPAYELPLHVREIQESDILRVQVGVPILDPMAIGPDGSHYYATVLDARAESPPDSLAEVRDQVLRNMRTIAAYERLDQLAEPARAIAASEGLDAARSFIVEEVTLDAEVTEPTIARDLVVFRGGVQATLPGQRAPGVLQQETFTDAVIDAALGLDPLAQPDTADPERTTLTVDLPLQATVAIARVRALRPLTAEAYRVAGEQLVSQIQQEEITTLLNWPDTSPYSLEHLSKALNYTYDWRVEGADEMPAPETEDPTQG
jgi:hypothetical protein